MHEYGSLPRARQDGLLEESVGEELLLYDQDSHTAHCLSPIAAGVWRHCDGAHDVADLAVLASVSVDLIVDALHELRERDLLVVEPVLTQGTVSGESRREAIIRVGRVGAGAAAATMVVSATAATPAMASSGEEAKKCCQCYEEKGNKCHCSFPKDDEECESICNGLTKCKNGHWALVVGTKCSSNGEECE